MAAYYRFKVLSQSPYQFRTDKPQLEESDIVIGSFDSNLLLLLCAKQCTRD